MTKKTLKIVISLAIVAGIAIIVFLALHHKTAEEKKDNLQDTATSVKVSEDNSLETKWCKKCHVTIDSIKITGKHASIKCQYCHGPAFKHTRYPQRNPLIVNSSKAFCLKCHAIGNVVSDKTIKQIDSLKHNAGSTYCITCHNPHSPLLSGSVSRTGSTKQVTEAACVICHANINKVRLSGNHKDISCQSCHGQGSEHVLSPSPKNINKPQSREFCAKCHAGGKASGKIKQIDLIEHNDGMKCVECHLAHNPLEFK